MKWNGRVFAHTSEKNHGITLSIFYFATVLESSFVYLSSYYSSLIIPAPTRGGKKVPYLSLVQKKINKTKNLQTFAFISVRFRIFPFSFFLTERQKSEFLSALIFPFFDFCLRSFFQDGNILILFF